MDYTESRDKLEEELAAAVIRAERHGLKHLEIAEILHSAALNYKERCKPLYPQRER